MKNRDIELIDYTGSIWGSHFLYVLPGNDWKIGQKFDISISKVLCGEARIVACTTLQLEKLSETVSRAFIGKSADELKNRYKNTYRLNDQDMVSILTWEWLHMDSNALKALMEERFDRMKGLRPHERTLQLQLL